MALVQQNILTAFQELGASVSSVLRTHLGNAARLNDQKRSCLQFLANIQQHLPHMDPADSHTILTSIEDMVNALETSVATLRYPPDAPPIILGNTIRSGQRGRPLVDIKPEDLALLASGRTTMNEIATFYQCGARTIRRRMLEFGLSEPGPAVYVEQELNDGSTERVYSRGSCSNLSKATDEELDAILISIYEQFPSFGRRMIDGYLMALGERVPRRRIEESYLRVIGPPVNEFGNRRIQRRIYSVPGPNSLWHHDGQHGLIRWKIVIHAFIDGFSRLLLGILASNNNRATTVLDLFENITDVFGYPSCVRGDHGTENLLVAALMEEVRGVGSYIWGKSVHNIRIERLWVDVTKGFGAKWKSFFEILEAHDGLNIDSDAHLWLLHHIFLDKINADAMAWSSTWNHHTLSRRNQSHQSPQKMFVQGMLTHGIRGIHQEQEVLNHHDDEYGIDWEDLDRRSIRQHHHNFNPEDHVENENPFVLNQPDRLSHVEVSDPRCPFNAEQLGWFKTELQNLPTISSTDMHSHRLTWIRALDLATVIVQ